MTREQNATNVLANANFSHDYIFGKVMLYKNNGLRLLRAIFPQLEINSLRRMQSQERIDNHYESHSVILDLFAEDDKGRVFDIEMQVKNNPGFWKRAWDYLGQIGGADLQKGKPYEDKKESFLVFIMAYDERGNGKFRYECDFLCDHKTVETGSSITLLNAQGKRGKVTPELRDVFHLMNDQLSKVRTPFGKQLIKDIDRAKLDLAKEREFMDWATKLQWTKEDAAYEANYQNALATAKQLRTHGIAEETIETILQRVYGANLPAQQIDQIMHLQ